MPLLEDQLVEYRTLGFVNAGPLFDVDRLEAIGKEYDRLVTYEAQTLGNEKEGLFPYRAMLNFRSPLLAECILEPRLLEMAVQLLGEDLRFWWDQGINKGPGSGSAIAWHQDNGYQNGRTQEFVTFWLALDDSCEENGGLQVIPGSSRNGLREHVWQGVHAVIPEDSIPLEQAVALDANAGDVLIFSSLLVHQTVGNRTIDRNRRAWVIQYCRADQRNIDTGEIYDNRPWAVRGGRFATSLESERPFDLRRDRA
jgi:hypothetical protein